MVLTTDRLLLRPVVAEDAEDFYEYSRNANVGLNAGWKPHESIEETRLIMEQVFMNREAVFGIVVKESGKLIGTIGLVKDPKRDNDSAYCYPHNQRSRRVLEKCGFLYEGTLRQCEQLFDGKTYDNECYALVGNE